MPFDDLPAPVQRELEHIAQRVLGRLRRERLATLEAEALSERNAARRRANGDAGEDGDDDGPLLDDGQVG